MRRKVQSRLSKNTGTLGKIRENHEKQTEMADVW